MREYRLSIWSMIVFAIAYPLVSGSVLIARWEGGIGEIYPIAPWTLFCFVPNHETDFAIRLTAIDGRPLDPPPFFEDYSSLAESQKTVASAIVQEMGRLHESATPDAFNEQRRLLESGFLPAVGRAVEYELVRRDYDVLERWKHQRYEKSEVVARFTGSLGDK